MPMDSAPKSGGLSPAEPLGTLTAPDTVRIERLLPASIDKVWPYIIDSEKRKKWFAEGPLELREQGEFTLTFRNYDLSAGLNKSGAEPAHGSIDHVMRGIVLKCDPPHLLQFNWEHDGSGSETTFMLTAVGQNTQIVITQRRLTSRQHILNVASGWHTHIGILIDLLAGTSPRLFWPSIAQVEGRYAAIVPE